jgi:hypothetical protein
MMRGLTVGEPVGPKYTRLCCDLILALNLPEVTHDLDIVKAARRTAGVSRQYTSLRASLIKILPLEKCSGLADSTILTAVIRAKDAAVALSGIAQTVGVDPGNHVELDNAIEALVARGDGRSVESEKSSDILDRDLRNRLAWALDIQPEASTTEFVEAAKSAVEEVHSRVDRDAVDLAKLRYAVMGYLSASGIASTDQLCDELLDAGREEHADSPWRAKYDALQVRHEHALRSAYHLAALACDVTGCDAGSIRRAADRAAQA